MTVVCCYCQRDMGEKDGPADLVSHGICKPCFEAVSATVIEIPRVTPKERR